MGKRKSPEKASDREKKWEMVFNALVKLSKNLQKDRDFLEERVRSLQEVIYRMQIEQKFESLKHELKLGLKDRDAFIYKRRYVKADDEISDLREWLECLSQKYPELMSTSDDVSNEGEGSQNMALQEQLKNLKSEFQTSALLAEKKFIWNQYNKMEGDLTEKLRKKSDEVESANKNVQLLVNRAEELQISNDKLRNDLSRVQCETTQKSEEIQRLLREIERLKSRPESENTPPLPPPHRAEVKSHCRGGKSSRAKSTVLTMKKESCPAKPSCTKRTNCKSTGEKASNKHLTESRSNSKRKASDVITILDTPKLFTAAFKIPKLKQTPIFPSTGQLNFTSFEGYR